MARSLKKAGLVACSYHAGMLDVDRESEQNRWKENECQVAYFLFENKSYEDGLVHWGCIKMSCPPLLVE